MLDFENIKRYPLEGRDSKVHIKDVKVPPLKESLKYSSWESVLELFPDIQTGRDIKEVAKEIKRIKKKGKKILWMMGAHAIKCGLSLFIIDWIKQGIIDHIAGNGAVSIHDFELSFIGKTSEDVGIALEDGSFGMAYETGHHLNGAIVKGAEKDMGMGNSIYNMLKETPLRYPHYSIIKSAGDKGIPITIHSAVGTDIIHQHPDCDGGALGKTSYNDFKILAKTITGLEGGMVFNLGSAVIMPEVFLKALTVARNLGFPVSHFTAVNLDMINHYRPRVNVLNRPTQSGGHSFFLNGSMEILLPLLWAGVRQE